MVNIHASNPMEYHIWMALNSKWLLIIPLINSAIFQWYKILHENSNSFQQANPFLCFSTNKVYANFCGSIFLIGDFTINISQKKLQGGCDFYFLKLLKLSSLQDRKMICLQYFYNIFITNHRWLVVIGSNLNLTLSLLFCSNNNN